MSSDGNHSDPRPAGSRPIGQGPGSAARMPSDKRRILVVDDDRSIREMFQTVLSCKLQDCHIDVAVGGEEAISMFEEAHHGIILMDMRMPEMEGDGAFRKIQEFCAANSWEEPCCVFITGFEPNAGVRSILDENRQHCLLRKPVKNKDLVRVLESRLKGRHAGGSTSTSAPAE